MKFCCNLVKAWQGHGRRSFLGMGVGEGCELDRWWSGHSPYMVGELAPIISEVRGELSCSLKLQNTSVRGEGTQFHLGWGAFTSIDGVEWGEGGTQLLCSYYFGFVYWFKQLEQQATSIHRAVYVFTVLNRFTQKCYIYSKQIRNWNFLNTQFFMG